jgi:hypothetical protein
MTLTAHEATITTATVEIRTLTVTGRQVTLAVFRQLLEERIEDHDGRLRGEPWGTVNYHPGKCADGPAHLHVVWQLGDELRRATARPPQPLGDWFGDDYTQKRRARWAESGSTWLAVALLNGWRPGPGTEIGHAARRALLVQFSSVVGIELGGAARALLRAEAGIEAYKDPHDDWAQKALARSQADLAEAHAELTASFKGEIPTFAEVTRWVQDELRDQDEHGARRQANWKQFQALPQLFIAV